MKTCIIVKNVNGTHRTGVVFSEFPDGDTYCLIKDTKFILGNQLIVVHDLYPDQNDRIVELLLLTDLLYELGARSVSLFVPYLPYARQDKRHYPGEAVSARSLCKLLSRADVRTLYTFDCHFLKGDSHATYAGLEIQNLTLGPFLLDHVKQHIGHDDYEVVGPDKGSNYLVSDHGSQHMYKERGDYDADGTVRHRSIQKMDHGHLKLRHDVVVIIDDMISTGGTMLKAVQNLEKLQKDVYCLAVHGLFLNDSNKTLAKYAKGVWASDSVPNVNAIPLIDKALQGFVIPAWLNGTND